MLFSAPDTPPMDFKKLEKSVCTPVLPDAHVPCVALYLDHEVNPEEAFWLWKRSIVSTFDLRIKTSMVIAATMVTITMSQTIIVFTLYDVFLI